MSVEIVRAVAEHAPFLTEIAVAAKGHWGYPKAWMEFWQPLLTITPEYIAEHETWVANMSGKPVAYYSLRADPEGLWLDNLWVFPETMGLGIGKALFTHALERARLVGVSILKIEADPHAVAFYERMGARTVGEHHGEVDGQPRILPVMEISL